MTTFFWQNPVKALRKNPDPNILAQWDADPWREPDVSVNTHDGVYAIWYGPGGVEGDAATEADPDYNGWWISEYSDIGWLYEEEGQPEPDKPFLKITRYVASDELEEALIAEGERLPDDPALMTRYAVGYGVAAIAHYGGEEEMVEELPR